MLLVAGLLGVVAVLTPCQRDLPLDIFQTAFDEVVLMHDWRGVHFTFSMSGIVQLLPYSLCGGFLIRNPDSRAVSARCWVDGLQEFASRSGTRVHDRH